jgi:tRNA/tmRNA/rRNA uracil-C5-methylase (TrmA/RlmC/RlmD family)
MELACKTDPNNKTETQNIKLSLKKFTQKQNDDLIQELQQYERENKDHIKWVLQQFSHEDTNCMEAKEAITNWNKYIFEKKKYDFMLKNPRHQPSMIFTPFQNNNSPFSISYM